MKSLGVFLGTVIAVGVLVGCQGTSDAGVTPDVSNSASVAPTTPVLSPTPVKDTLNAEAEARYRAFLVEQGKLQEAGGADSLTPQLEGFVDEPFRSSLLKAFTTMNEAGVRVKGVERIADPTVTVIDHSGIEGALVALHTCVDGSPSTVIGPDGSQQAGEVISTDYWFKRDAAGALRIFYGVTEVVAGC